MIRPTPRGLREAGPGREEADWAQCGALVKVVSGVTLGVFTALRNMGRRMGRASVHAGPVVVAEFAAPAVIAAPDGVPGEADGAVASVALA